MSSPDDDPAFFFFVVAIPAAMIVGTGPIVSMFP